MNIRRILLSSLLGLTALGFVGINAVRAATYESASDNNTVTISSLKDTKPLYATGQNVVIDTPLPSDAVVAGSDITVKQPISGSLLASGGHISVNASVAKSIRVAGQDISIADEVGEDVSAIAATVVIDKSATILGDLHVLAGTLTINGHVNGSVYFSGPNLTVNGTVDGDIQSMVSKLTVSDTGTVGGDLTYISNDQANITAGTVKGRVTQHIPSNFGSYDGSFWSVLSSIIVGIVLIHLFRYKIQRVAHEQAYPQLSNGLIGLVTVIFAPIPIVLLMLSIVGIPLGLVTLSLYAITMYLTTTLAAILIGWICLNLIKARIQELWMPYAALLIGLAITLILRHIPIIGPVALSLVWLVTLGAFLRADLQIWQKLRHSKEV